MSYNYLESMKDDVMEYIKETDLSQYEDMDELRESLNDDLWTVDSVTGNASGSYTFNRTIAKEYVLDNIDLLKEAYEEFSSKEKFADEFFEEDFESMDVTIRCYLLSQAIEEALEEMEEELEEAFEEEEEEEEEE